MKLFTIKRLLISGIVIAAVICLLPTFLNTWPHKKISLGLDLQGGMHLVLEVQNEKAVEAEMERTVQELKKEMRSEDIKHLGSHPDRGQPDPGQSWPGRMPRLPLKKSFRIIFPTSWSPQVKPQADGIDFVLSLSDDEAANIKKMATEQALETIRNRIDEFGVSEPDIRIQGDKRILLQLPGIKDPDRAKGLIGKTAQLTFQLVNDDADVSCCDPGQSPCGFRSPLSGEERTPATGQCDQKSPSLIKKQVLLDGSLLTNARVEFDQFQQPQVGH